MHVHRISNRLGWVKTRQPEETRAVRPPLSLLACRLEQLRAYALCWCFSFLFFCCSYDRHSRAGCRASCGPTSTRCSWASDKRYAGPWVHYAARAHVRLSVRRRQSLCAGPLSGLYTRTRPVTCLPLIPTCSSKMTISRRTTGAGRLEQRSGAGYVTVKTEPASAPAIEEEPVALLAVSVSFVCQSVARRACDARRISACAATGQTDR